MHRPHWDTVFGAFFVSLWFIGLLFAGLSCCAATAQAAGDPPRVAVDDSAFTPTIGDDRQPAQRILRVKSGAQPFFWTLLSANAATLEALRGQGKLPIMHAWRRYLGQTVLEKADTTKLEGDIPLDLGTSALADQLQYEIDHSPRHVFTWRTWSQKGPLTPGAWSVFIKYADGTPVICQVVNGVGIPCAYRLDVQAP